MRCLILGQGKSGSSALFFAIADAMNAQNRVFEPVPMKREEVEPQGTVVKKLIEFLEPEEMELLGLFDKKIFLIRDPRDMIVSRLLYIVWDRKFVYDDEKIAEWIGAIEKKEADPSSISVVELYDLMNRLDEVNVIGAVKRLNDKTLNFWREHKEGFYVFRYEDFVQGKLDALSEFLGVEVKNQVEVANHLSRVKRKKSFGDWKSWFTPKDIEYFSKEFAGILDEFGYSEDWELNPNPVIEPEFSSEYVRRIVKDKRESAPLSQ